jgi:hypothetical protein
MLGDKPAWLKPGKAATEDSVRLMLTAFSLSAGPGALFVVRDARLRPLVFAGFGLTLLGLLLSALRRRKV